MMSVIQCLMLVYCFLVYKVLLYPFSTWLSQQATLFWAGIIKWNEEYIRCLADAWQGWRFKVTTLGCREVKGGPQGHRSCLCQNDFKFTSSGSQCKPLSCYLKLTFWVPTAQRIQPEKIHLCSSFHSFPRRKLLIDCNVKCFSYHFLISFLCPLLDMIMGRKNEPSKEKREFQLPLINQSCLTEKSQKIQKFFMHSFLGYTTSSKWRNYLIYVSYSSRCSASTRWGWDLKKCRINFISMYNWKP